MKKIDLYGSIFSILCWTYFLGNIFLRAIGPGVLNELTAVVCAITVGIFITWANLALAKHLRNLKGP